MVDSKEVNTEWSTTKEEDKKNYAQRVSDRRVRGMTTLNRKIIRGGGVMVVVNLIYIYIYIYIYICIHIYIYTYQCTYICIYVCAPANFFHLRMMVACVFTPWSSKHYSLLDMNIYLYLYICSGPGSRHAPVNEHSFAHW